MTVNNTWLVNVNVNINTFVPPVLVFNSCALIGVMPSQTSPYQSPPSTWAETDFVYNTYNTFSEVSADFNPLLIGAVTAGDILQADRFNWLLSSAAAFFAQSPTPEQLIIFAEALPGSSTDYVNYFTSITNVQNNWYGFEICDLILANAFSYCIVKLTTNEPSVVVPVGTGVTPETATAPYQLLQPYTLVTTSSSGSTFLIPFYSTDATTPISISTFTAISPSIATVTAVTNLTAAVNGVPGYTTPLVGVNAGLAALRGASNQKKLFADFNDYTQASIIQASALASQDLTCFYHSLNLQAASTNAATSNTALLAPIASASLAAGCLGEYFVNVFQGANGLTVLSSMQLTSVPTDPSIQTSNIGTPGQTGSATNLIGWNNNVYPGFGSANIGLVQYGYQSNSLATAQVYLDQIVGGDYIQFIAQADLVALIVNSLPSGIPYNDSGIQQVVNTFKNSMQDAVDEDILQPFTNASFSYPNYNQVSQTDVTNRIYRNLTYTGTFLSRIQRISVNVNLSI